ncbi:MAG: hypothetical protein IPL49_16265 [Saprospirales bacterium]|nr:hypothetical protein [Saprospirales bacterium]
MSILLLLGLPSFLFAQDTLILHSGEKITFDRLYRAPTHTEYELDGARYYLPEHDFDKIIRRVPRNLFSLYLFYGFGGMEDELYRVVADLPSLSVPIGNYAERDHEYQYFTGGPMFQYGHSVKGRNVIGVWGGVESFGSFYARESWERHTDEYISVGARKFLHYFHLALSPYYRTYFFRNKFHLQLGPYVGMLKYNLDIFYQNSNTIVGVNDRYEGEIHDIIYHPGLQAGVGWNWAHEKNSVFSLEIQWHHGFGQKIEEFRYKNVVLVDEYDLRPTQFLFGLKYSIR